MQEDRQQNTAPECDGHPSCSSASLSRYPAAAGRLRVCRALVPAAALLFAVGAAAQQGAPATGAAVSGQTAPPAAAAATPEASTSTPALPPSLLEQPAAPATVEAAPDSLTVRADNSSLTSILNQVASKTGMQLEGLAGDERVFGTFGPGAPTEVLQALLNGTSYNVMMVGDLDNGAPRELLLTQRASGPAPSAAPQNTSRPPNDPDNSDDSDDDNGPPPPPQSYAPQPRPGAPPAPTPRTPQQLLQQMQRLQQIRNQQAEQPNE